jgi:hypothetical protein
MLSSLRVKTASITILLAASGSAYAAGPALIALTGLAAPGGGTYSAFSNPATNYSGQVAFDASVAGGTSTSGLFTGTTSTVQAVALQGTAAPSGGNYGSLYSSQSNELAVINVNGQLAFNAPLTGGTSTLGSFTGTSAATLQTIALQGTAAPAGGNYNAFLAQGTNTPYSPVLNDAGQVAIQSSLTGGSAAYGIFAGSTAANLQTVALVGGTAPNGGTYASIVTMPTINGNGQVAFIGLPGGVQGIFAGAPGSAQTVMLSGTAAPTTGETYGNPSTTYSYNTAGQVGFQAALTGGASSQGVFVGSPGNVLPVVLNNTLAAGGSGGLYNALSSVNVNSAGRLAFSASLNGGTATSGLFVGTPTSVTAVALVGGTSPDGSTYTVFNSTLLQNGVGQVAFLATVTGAGITAGTNDGALFAGTPGNLVDVVYKGETIDLGANSGGSEFRTVADSVSSIGLLVNAGGQDGKGDAFSDSGEIAYKLTFTDGSSGIFESNVNSVPEPASLGLLAAGAGLLIRRNRRKPLQSI